MHKVQIKRGKEGSLARKHPWVFSGALTPLEIKPEDGDWVEIQDQTGRILGFGHFSADKTIAVRVLSFSRHTPDQNWWNARFSNALQWRTRLGLHTNKNTSTFRWIHGEGDGLPGLIVDCYSGVAVVQFHTTGMARCADAILQAMREAMGDALLCVYNKSSKLAEGTNHGPREDGVLWGELPEVVWGWEHGHRFIIDLVQGQKTGFFIDQRDNRSIIGGLCRDATVLNAFSYTGGFSVAALAGGASRVDSLDSSLRALEIAHENILSNGFHADKHRKIQEDAMHFVKGDLSEYDCVILDPPAFAKRMGARHAAVQGYKRLNAHAMQGMKAGSILATFSCSQAVDESMFYNTLVAAAIEAQRDVRVLHKLHQPPDHPVGIFHAEGAYLKGLVLAIN